MILTPIVDGEVHAWQPESQLPAQPCKFAGVWTLCPASPDAVIRSTYHNKPPTYRCEKGVWVERSASKEERKLPDHAIPMDLLHQFQD